MAEENSTASNFIWAIAFIVIVAIIAATVFYSGILKGSKKENIDIKVETPSVAR